MDARPGWDRYFLDIASVVAGRSDCRRAKVGAVIVDREHHIISTGYVGVAPGEPGCLAGACPRGSLTADECSPGSSYENCISLHAEVNALAHSDRSRHRGGSIYITREPCDWCSKVLRASGLHFAYWAEDQKIQRRTLYYEIPWWGVKTPLTPRPC